MCVTPQKLRVQSRADRCNLHCLSGQFTIGTIIRFKFIINDPGAFVANRRKQGWTADHRPMKKGKQPADIPG